MRNKILALYPDLEDHHVLHEAFADSPNEIVCVTTLSEAVRLLVDQSFTLVFIDSKLIAGRSNEIATTIKTVSEALYNQVPLVLYPQTNEQKGVSTRVREVGAGIPLTNDSPEGILKAVREILNHADYKANAKRIAESFYRCGGSKAAAEKILAAAREKC